jgi:hypothetical protein
MNKQYTIKDAGYCITVKRKGNLTSFNNNYTNDCEFFLQGDDANQFRNEWDQAQENNIDFDKFLFDYSYDILFYERVK